MMMKVVDKVTQLWMACMMASLCHAFYQPTYVAPSTFIKNLATNSQALPFKDFRTLSSSFPYLSSLKHRMALSDSASARDQGQNEEQVESPEPEETTGPKPYVYISSTHPMDESGKRNDPNYIPEQCIYAFTPNRTIAFASDYFGPEEGYFYFDPTHTFLKSVVGFNDTEVFQSMSAALQHFEDQFGINFNPLDATYSTETGTFTKGEQVLSPIVQNVTMRVVADSYYNTPCADVTAVAGGWLFTVNETAGENSAEVTDTNTDTTSTGVMSFASLIFVFMPGTAQRTRIGFYPEFPTTCDAQGACPISGPTVNFEDQKTGWIDGSLIWSNSAEHGQTGTSRIVAMWPGRITPMLE